MEIIKLMLHVWYYNCVYFFVINNAFEILFVCAFGQERSTCDKGSDILLLLFWALELKNMK